MYILITLSQTGKYCYWAEFIQQPFHYVNRIISLNDSSDVIHFIQLYIVVCLTLTSDDVTQFHQPVSVHHQTPGEGRMSCSCHVSGNIIWVHSWVRLIFWCWNFTLMSFQRQWYWQLHCILRARYSCAFNSTQLAIFSRMYVADVDKNCVIIATRWEAVEFTSGHHKTHGKQSIEFLTTSMSGRNSCCS